MRKRGICASILALALLSGCESTPVPEEDVDYSIQINLPYTTSTPSPTGEIDLDGGGIVITAAGDVVVRDPSAVEIPFGALGQESGYVTLTVGSHGEEVLALEERLFQLNYMDGKPDDVFDGETEQACVLFSATYSRLGTGVATPSLQAALFDSSAPVYDSDRYYAAVESGYLTLQRGDSGDTVQALQKRLCELGFPGVAETGTFDDATGEAVSLFFREYGLDRCLVATIAMQKELFSDTARPFSGVEATVTATPAADTGNRIEPGSAGSRVAMLEERLYRLGYPGISVNGVYDAADSTAVAQIQQSLSLAPNGVVEDGLYPVLLSDVIPDYGSLAPGDTDTVRRTGVSEEDYGIDVQRVQIRLTELGYAAGTPNGRYDEVMKEAVRRFQSKAGLLVTGELTDCEMSLLYAPFAPRYADPTQMEEVLTRDGDARLVMEELTPGSVGERVYYVGMRLVCLGYLSAWYSETFDETLADAVMQFQRSCGIAQTGCVSAGLYRFMALPVAPTPERALSPDRRYEDFEFGMSCYEVRLLQRALLRDGLILESDVNGQYDESTRLAVEQLERSAGCGVSDGIASAGLAAYYLSGGMLALVYGQ